MLRRRFPTEHPTALLLVHRTRGSKHWKDQYNWMRINTNEWGWLFHQFHESQCSEDDLEALLLIVFKSLAQCVILTTRHCHSVNYPNLKIMVDIVRLTWCLSHWKRRHHFKVSAMHMILASVLNILVWQFHLISSHQFSCENIILWGELYIKQKNRCFSLDYSTLKLETYSYPTFSDLSSCVSMLMGYTGCVLNEKNQTI